MLTLCVCDSTHCLYVTRDAFKFMECVLLGHMVRTIDWHKNFFITSCKYLQYNSFLLVNSVHKTTKFINFKLFLTQHFSKLGFFFLFFFSLLLQRLKGLTNWNVRLKAITTTKKRTDFSKSTHKLWWMFIHLSILCPVFISVLFLISSIFLKFLYQLFILFLVFVPDFN